MSDSSKRTTNGTHGTADAVVPLPPLPPLGKADWVRPIVVRSQSGDWEDHRHAALANLARLVLLAVERYRSADAEILKATGQGLFIEMTFRIPSDVEICILATFRAWRLSNLLTEEFRAPEFSPPSPDLTLQTLAEVRDLATHFDDGLSVIDKRLRGRPRFPPDRINMPVPKERGIVWGDYLIRPQALADTVAALWKHTTVVSDWAQQQTDWMQEAEAS